ncbi:hypothetical protein [Streptomyces sp. NRRL B-24484]|uniref:hypothetical protein n=1 Tax=Streptomyces sp. NRRL B-24484 TaxID=1463833 RepID=UPI0004C23ACD|nr:hypothetical protein [Streptomyces sp. NRRL B-24484]
MEKIIPTEGLRATLLWPVTGLCTGTPVLVRRLMTPHRERRAEAAALQAKRERIAAEVAEAAEVAFAKKLIAETDPVKRVALLQAQEAGQVAAREVELERAKAARKASFEKFKDSAGAAALLLVVGGPLVWSLARPWVGPGIGLFAGVWWIAALIHAPAPAKAATEDDEQLLDGDDFDADEDGDDQEDEPAAAVPPTLTDAELTTTIEHMVAIRARRDGGAGKVHLAEILETLQRHHRYTGYTAREFGTAVRSAGLPVEKSVRVTGESGSGVSPGLSFEGLRAHLGHPPRLPAQAVPEPAPAVAV